MGFQENLNSLVQAINNRAKLSDIEPIGDLIANSSSHVPLSGVTSYHLLSGNLALANSVITNGFATTLYTGNGTTQSVVTGVDMATQWGNSASETFGGLVWCKGRNQNYYNVLFDTIRGVNYNISSNTTGANSFLANTLTSFNNNGFSLGSDLAVNGNTTTYASWVFQTTHRTSGITNHGKAYTCHYNPYTGFTIVKYEGSGRAGHEIPHHLGRKLGFKTTKNLSSANSWIAYHGDDSKVMYLNETTAGSVVSGLSFTENSCVLAGYENTASNQYILYGWANSYFDEANTLIGNYEIGIYQGTGAAGNKVTTRGKPAWVMIKRLDSTGDWSIFDNQRVSGINELGLYANLSIVEDSTDRLTWNSDGFSLVTTAANQNASGGQYLYMVVYDNDSGSGKSKYPRATDTSTLNLNATIPFANGLDTSGVKNSILSKNETVAGLTLTEGKNYVYSKNDGTYGVTPHAPQYGSLKSRTYASEAPEFFDVLTNKWYTTTGHGELISNGTFNTDISGWTNSYGTGTVDWVNGELRTYSTTAVSVGARYQVPIQAGRRYRIRAKYRVVSGDMEAYIRLVDGSNNVKQTLLGAATGTGSIDTTIIASESNLYLQLLADSGATTDIRWDDVSIYDLDPILGPEITESRNYLDAIVYADAGGQPTYVEQLPKTIYFDKVKVLNGFDLNQTWQNVTANRVAGTTYTNTTGKPIMVSININMPTSSSATLTVSGVLVSRVGTHDNAAGTAIDNISIVIPNGGTYLFTNTGTVISSWAELR